MKDLLECRKEIDEIDRDMGCLLEKRMQIAAEVAEYKRATGKKVFDRQREEEKLNAAEKAAKDAEMGKYRKEILSQIMAQSRKHQYAILAEREDFGFISKAELCFEKEMKTAFFGEVGSYTEEALMHVFGEESVRISCQSFQKVLEMVESKEVAFGVVPIENTTIGGISDTYDLLAKSRVFCIYEVVLPVKHCLATKKDVNATRFLVLSGTPEYLSEADKISICFEIPHETGSLSRILSHLSFNGLNMTRIESRPIAENPFEYRFFVDFDGSLSEAAVKNALTGIKEESSYLRILGCMKTN